MSRVRKSVAFSEKNKLDMKLLKFAEENCRDNFNEYIKSLIQQEKNRKERITINQKNGRHFQETGSITIKL
jgi:hypothetical protein